MRLWRTYYFLLWWERGLLWRFFSGHGEARHSGNRKTITLSKRGIYKGRRDKRPEACCEKTPVNSQQQHLYAYCPRLKDTERYPTSEKLRACCEKLATYIASHATNNISIFVVSGWHWTITQLVYSDTWHTRSSAYYSLIM